MKLFAGRWLRWIALGAAIAAYAALAHLLSARGTDAGAFGVAVALAPYLGVALLLAWRSTRRLPLLALWLASVALLWSLAGDLAQHIGALYFIQHVATNLVLAAVFGVTLGAGRQPLCARFAAAVHGTLDARLSRYTRQVTQAWTIYFLATAALSVLLFVAAPVWIWSIFANVLTLPLVGLMFAAEYAVRRWHLRDIDHIGLIDSMRLYWDSSRPQLPPAP